MFKFLLFVILIVFLVIFIFLSPLFKVKTIDLAQGQNCLSQENLAQTLVGKNIFLISQTQLENKIRSTSSCIRSLKIKKIFPSKMRLEVETDKPVFKVEGTNIYLTSNGLVVEGSDFEKLPVLYLGQSSKVSLGQKITDETVLSSLDLVSQLAKSDFTVASVRIIDQETIAVYNPQGSIVVFSFKKAINGQVDSLQQVISKAKIDAAKIAKIDLRFDKPVVTYE